MSAEVFFDTNVLIYSLERGTAHAATAQAEVANGGTVSVHVMNECANVLLRKMAFSWSDIRDALDEFDALLGPPRPITMQTHAAALDLAERDRLNIYDALIVASAIEAGCRILLSEDMQDGRVIGGLAIRNPFAG